MTRDVLAVCGALGGLAALVMLIYFVRDRRVGLLRQERDDEQRRRVQLEDRLGKNEDELRHLRMQRTNEPVLEAVAKTNDALATVLDKLVTVNGSLGRQEQALKTVTEGLETATEALKMIAGMVVGAADLPMQRHKP